MEQNKLQDMIRISLENIRAMVDANTVVGTPINTPSGTTIIPISKVSVGYASGGVDWAAKTGSSQNFGGGGGTGLSVQPVCFLAVSASGRVELFPVEGGKTSTLDRIAVEDVESIKEYFVVGLVFVFIGNDLYRKMYFSGHSSLIGELDNVSTSGRNCFQSYCRKSHTFFISFGDFEQYFAISRAAAVVVNGYPDFGWLVYYRVTFADT